MTFLINQPRSHEFPSFQRPRILGYLSINGPKNGQREYSEDLSQLKYFCSSAMYKTGYDLNKGINKVIRKPPNLNEKLNHILKWILNNLDKVKADPGVEKWFAYIF